MDNTTIKFILNVVATSFIQIMSLLGIIFVYGLLLCLLARFTRIIHIKTIGDKLDIIITGWIGTPVHELGHAIFCILFCHRIIEIRFYSPDLSNGTLGYVKHTYNSKSHYQKIGNFFIGIGPILFGSFILYVLLYFLMPGITVLCTKIEQQSLDFIHSGYWNDLWNTFRISIASILGGIFDIQNISNWRFWIFIYLSFCIFSHMELSPLDIKGARNGLISIVLTVLIFNLLILSIERLGIQSYLGKYWQYAKLETYTIQINEILSTLSAFLSYALIISGFNFILSYIVLSLYNLIRGRGLINPFWN
jgi:hypothetical protein